VLPARLYATLFGGSGSHLFGSGPHQGALYFVIVGLAAIPALAILDIVDWDDIQSIDWGTIVLLGGGISLANALSRTDATRWLAEGLVNSLLSAPVLLVALVIATATIAVSGLFFGSVGFAAGFGTLVAIPYSRASTRKREINMLLSDSISFMYALSVGG
jgi:sodium-dependent dicarboxylate transporter 2/3/5